MNFFLEFNAQKRIEIDVKLTEFRHLKLLFLPALINPMKRTKNETITRLQKK